MSAKVYDFATGKLCKCCSFCGYWKDTKDFPADETGTYGVARICQDCVTEANTNNVSFTFEMGPDNEVA